MIMMNDDVHILVTFLSHGNFAFKGFDLHPLYDFVLLGKRRHIVLLPHLHHYGHHPSHHYQGTMLF